MKYFIAVSILFIISLNLVSGQKNIDTSKTLYGDDCVYKQKYSAFKRSKIYPFDVADSIKLISFRQHRNNYPIKGDSIIADSLIEIKKILRSSIDTLTDILYNNFYYKPSNIGSMTQCFYPRNAILFLDKTGHVKEYVLICFHCNRYEVSSSKVYLGDNCNQKMEKLRIFFSKMGIKFGTDRNIGSYPGEDSDQGVIK